MSDGQQAASLDIPHASEPDVGAGGVCRHALARCRLVLVQFCRPERAVADGAQTVDSVVAVAEWIDEAIGPAARVVVGSEAVGGPFRDVARELIELSPAACRPHTLVCV